ncbi:hypothetical protein IPH70_02080 [Candidatus Roizmanbacteria bacterium]|nr:MAG: hypothetical protein IPH70_02080 [Candidatus Roizmanbacteria bacterium]
MALQEKRQQLFAKDDESVSIDVTLPGDKYPKGSLHTTTYAIEEISKIFEKIGFIRVSYPEVDWEYFAFEALNMPAGHPARDDFETFLLMCRLILSMGVCFLHHMLLMPRTVR